MNEFKKLQNEIRILVNQIIDNRGEYLKLIEEQEKNERLASDKMHLITTYIKTNMVAYMARFFGSKKTLISFLVTYVFLVGFSVDVFIIIYFLILLAIGFMIRKLVLLTFEELDIVPLNQLKMVAEQKNNQIAYKKVKSIAEEKDLYSNLYDLLKELLELMNYKEEELINFFDQLQLRTSIINEDFNRKEEVIASSCGKCKVLSLSMKK